MNQHLHLDETNFHMKGFALALALKHRRKATRKSPIVLFVCLLVYSFQWGTYILSVCIVFLFCVFVCLLFFNVPPFCVCPHD